MRQALDGAMVLEAYDRLGSFAAVAEEFNAKMPSIIKAYAKAHILRLQALDDDPFVTELSPRAQNVFLRYFGYRPTPQQISDLMQYQPAQIPGLGRKSEFEVLVWLTRRGLTLG